MKTLEPELDLDTSHVVKSAHRRAPIVLAILVVLVVAGFFAGSRVRSALTPADQNQYSIAAASVSNVQKTVSATGTLQPWSTVDIKSKAGGRVNALLVDVGSVVHVNQVIARIDPSDSQVAVDTAQASLTGAVAHTQQAAVTYQLQVSQSQIAITNAQAALDAAVASRDSASAQLASAQASNAAQPELTASSIQQAQASYKQATKAYDAQLATDIQDTASAQSAYDQAVANQAVAKSTLDRQVGLAKQGFVAQQTVDTDKGSYSVAVAQTQSARAKLNTIQAEQAANDAASAAKVAQERSAVLSAKAQSVDIDTKRVAVKQAVAALNLANAQVAEAKESLAQAKANVANDSIKRYDITFNQSELTSNKATLDNAQTTLDQTIVRSPSDGIVVTKDVSQGTYITSGESFNSSGTTIVTIGDVTRMYVQATVDETDLASIDAGQAVSVTFDAYPGLTFDGKVARIDPEAQVNNNVTQFNVRVEIDNSTPTFRLLKPGMNATCDFNVAEKDNVLSVPNQAVQTDDQGTFVLVAKGGQPAPSDASDPSQGVAPMLVGVRVEKRAVQIGVQGDDLTEITSGLKAGEKVVTAVLSSTPSPTSTSQKSAFGGGGGPGGGPGGPP